MSDSAHNNLRSLAFLPRHTDEPARDWAWRILLHNICMARLLPGNIINTAELARIMGLSRTPIHEACVMIEDRGLVERIDRSKTVISLINMDEVRQYCFILTTVEPWIYSSASQEQWTAHATSLIKTIADIRSARLHHEGAAELLRLSQRYRYTCYQAAGMDDCWNMLRSASLAYIRASMLAMLLDEWRLGPLAYELLFAAARNPIDSPLGTAALLPRLLASKLKSLEQLASSYPYFFVS